MDGKDVQLKSTQRDVPQEGNGKINLITSWMYLSDIGYIITDKTRVQERKACHMIGRHSDQFGMVKKM